MRMLTMIIPLALATPAAAQATPQSMTTGPVFSFGPVAEVDSDMSIPADAEFKVVFDLAEAAPSGQVNRGLVTLARFYNMHVRAGVPEERIHLAVVVHGAAGGDLLNKQAYAARNEDSPENANAPIIAALLDKGVRVILCGQSAAAMGIAKDALLPGVEMALSAMTAHALLQQQGYTLNPF